MSTRQIAVIGAGLAGLTAAYRLYEQGYKNIDIYEARGRVGGRVFSVRLMDSIVELGGQNIPDGGEAPTLKALAHEMELSLLEDEIELKQAFYDQDTNTCIDMLKLQQELFPLKGRTTLRAKLQDLAAHSKNMEEILLALFPHKGILYRSLVLKFAVYEGGHPSQVSSDAWDSLYYMLCGGIAAVHETNRIKRATIEGGNSKLALALAKKLEGRIHLSCPLKAMRLSENNRILLTFEGDARQECDKVILTLPCSVYKDIEIDPHLIPSKELAFIHKIAYGDNTKILLPVSYDALPYNSILTDEMASFVSNDNHICGFYFAGEAGRKLQNNMEELYARALTAVTAATPSLTYSSSSPQVVNDNTPLALYNNPITHSWVDDPYAKGSYSFRAADIMPALSHFENYRGENIRTPYKPIQDRVFFAGEHTAIDADLGTMEGAVESGERAARMVAASEKGAKLNHAPQIQRFRKVTREDRFLLNHLMRQGKGYWGYPEEGLDRWMAEFSILNDSYFDSAFGCAAESDKDIIGYYLFKIIESPPMLDYFFLDVRFIGQGYGRKLWEHCIEQAKNREWKEFTFYSDPHSLGFYEHMGAVKIGEGPMITTPGLMFPIMHFTIPGS